MKSENVVVDKSKAFAIRIVRMYQYLRDEKKEFVLSKQVLRSGTGIGANIKEAIVGYSKDDFRFKMSIALKEASETEYWLELLHDTDYITDASFESMTTECKELIRIITAILNSSKQ